MPVGFGDGLGWNRICLGSVSGPRSTLYSIFPECCLSLEEYVGSFLRGAVKRAEGWPKRKGPGRRVLDVETLLNGRALSGSCPNVALSIRAAHRPLHRLDSLNQQRSAGVSQSISVYLSLVPGWQRDMAPAGPPKSPSSHSFGISSTSYWAPWSERALPWHLHLATGPEGGKHNQRAVPSCWARVVRTETSGR